MKNIFVLFIISSILISCQKYQEGPGISLISKKNRITNTWVLKSRISNDISVDLTNWTWIITINDDGTYNLKIAYVGLDESTQNGTWQFTTDKSGLLIKQNGSNNQVNWDIVRLTKDELKLRYQSGSSTNIDTFSAQ
jgi:uncharacterized lipoprotein NlpE involved in copper resistance